MRMGPISLEVEYPVIDKSDDVEVNINFFIQNYSEEDNKSKKLLDNIMLIIPKEELVAVLNGNPESMLLSRNNCYDRVSNILTNDCYSCPPESKVWEILRGSYSKCYDELRSLALCDAAMALMHDKSFQGEEETLLIFA